MVDSRNAVRGIDVVGHGDNAMMASVSGGQPVRRLELRVGYPPEAPDPDFLSLRLLVDGQDILTWAGSRGPYIAPSARAVGPPVIHTAEEAARLLKVKQSWLERQAANRKIPFTMLGGSYRFTDRHLAEIVSMNEVTPVPAPIDSARPPRKRRSDHPPLEALVTPPGFERLRPRPRGGPRRAP